MTLNEQVSGEGTPTEKHRKKKRKRQDSPMKRWVPAIVSAGAGLGVIGLSLWLWSILQESL